MAQRPVAYAHTSGHGSWTTLAFKVDEIVGDAIRSRRIAMGLTLDALATLANVAAPRLEQLERGLERAKAVELLALSRPLQTTISFFFEEFDERQFKVARQARACSGSA